MPPNLVRKDRRHSLIAMTLLGVGIAMGLWAAHMYHGLRMLNAEVAEAVATHADLKRQRATRPASTAKQDSISELAERQAWQLGPTLAWLERTWTNDLAYARIDMDGAARTQRLDVEARHDDALLALVDALSAMPDVTAVSLVRQRRSETGIEATLELRWRETSR
ncbi:MAG: hypothetical protein JO067_07380 [Cupriavidus sp.]|nr:hypothetical protein [Cupriavidus sp.]